MMLVPNSSMQNSELNKLAKKINLDDEGSLEAGDMDEDENKRYQSP